MRSGNCEQGIGPYDWFGEHSFVAALTPLESGAPLGRLRDDDQAVWIAPSQNPSKLSRSRLSSCSPRAPVATFKRAANGTSNALRGAVRRGKRLNPREPASMAADEIRDLEGF